MVASRRAIQHRRSSLTTRANGVGSCSWALTLSSVGARSGIRKGQYMIHLPPPRLCPCGVVHRIPVEADLAHKLRPYDDIFLTSATKDLMNDAMDESVSTGMLFGSLHSAYSTTGVNELTGGSPAYARKGLTWGASSGGSKALTATFPVWDVPAAGVVAWIGFWTLVTAGVFRGMLAAGAGALQGASVEVSGDITTNLVFAKAHGYIADTRVVFWGAVPTGLTIGTQYFVIATGLTADAFSVALTSGGAAIDITGTAPFSFFVQKCVPEVFAGQGTYTVSSLSFDQSAVA